MSKRSFGKIIRRAILSCKLNCFEENNFKKKVHKKVKEKLAFGKRNN